MSKAHEIDHRIVGDDMQAVIITLDPGEAVQAEAGATMFIEDDIIMNTGTGGGIFKGMKRVLAGESFFITTSKLSLILFKIFSLLIRNPPKEA